MYVNGLKLDLPSIGYKQIKRFLMFFIFNVISSPYLFLTKLDHNKTGL